MYIESVPNRNSPPAILLRESFRQGGKVRKRTLANLSKWPPALVDGLKALLLPTPARCRRRCSTRPTWAAATRCWATALLEGLPLAAEGRRAGRHPTPTQACLQAATVALGAHACRRARSDGILRTATRPENNAS